jgi:hypothetical protein
MYQIHKPYICYVKVGNNAHVFHHKMHLKNSSKLRFFPKGFGNMTHTHGIRNFSDVLLKMHDLNEGIESLSRMASSNI